MNTDVETALEEIVGELSRLRSQVEALDLPAEGKQALLEHLSLASAAALRMRFKGGGDDLIVVDD